VAHECDPGKHEFASISEGGALLDAELLPDKIYYVQVAIHMGFGRARNHFEVVRPGSEAMDEFLKTKNDLRGGRPGVVRDQPEGGRGHDRQGAKGRQRNRHLEGR
jgi:hypothetical protein